MGLTPGPGAYSNTTTAFKKNGGVTIGARRDINFQDYSIPGPGAYQIKVPHLKKEPTTRYA